MTKPRYIYWKEEAAWLGYLDEYPDYWTQGKSLGELKANLADIYRELRSGRIPHVRKAANLAMS